MTDQRNVSRKSTRRKLPEVPPKERANPYWTDFSNDEDIKLYDDHLLRPVYQNGPYNYHPNYYQRPIDRLHGPQKAQSMYERDERRQRLASIVTNQINSEQYPMTSGYVNKWLRHNHEDVNEFHSDCNVCVNERLEESLSNGVNRNLEQNGTGEINDLKYKNPLLESNIK